MGRRPRNCVKFHRAQLKSRVTRADTGAVPAVTPRIRARTQIMTTRKQQTPAKKRARSRPARHGLPPRAPRGRGDVRRKSTRREPRDGALLLAADCTVAQADTLKSELERRLQEPAPVTLDVGALQRIDTAGLQLLAAFVRDRRTAGRAVTWRGEAASLTTAASLLGLSDMLELPREAG